MSIRNHEVEPFLIRVLFDTEEDRATFLEGIERREFDNALTQAEQAINFALGGTNIFLDDNRPYVRIAST